ncbi:hypothetical protein F5Y00DRAFT_226610 [Daldinia vernicosa]|uniref:uncharacterized protein n=1 Tax=Daldinia vernicosa TaxID=114800 RepID=UPI002007DD8D|nr:uncharacterized protein F5Y00DRAFT_226610 [Daldinia vernicosa]KAI0852435.1 hypothetical protein F5Y00DRAFT_226610 [Daldinia vernicosa]
MSSSGQWVSCECCFTIVHDVLVACTSIYRRGERSKSMFQMPYHVVDQVVLATNGHPGRAIEAPHIRRIFSSSPRDPRYHMLEHLSPKFKMQPMEREPRAALILNRFTRTLTVMFATNAVSSILGVRPDQIKDKSFYECIAENCLADAIKCLESAKANDSIAYLRFWYRDPRREEDFEEEDDEDDEDDEEDDEDIENGHHDELSKDNDEKLDGHVHAENAMDVDFDESYGIKIKTEAGVSPELSKADILANGEPRAFTRSYQTSGVACHQIPNSAMRANRRRRRNRNPIPTFELEAVVSCTSDGLVVVLRKARPPIPSLHPPLLPIDFENGLFAAPWSEQPIRPYYPPEHFYTFRPPLLPQYMPLREHVKAAGGPPVEQLMKSIRDVAVFAWALVGINGNYAAYSRGVPRESSQPHDELPTSDSKAPTSSHIGFESQSSQQSQHWGGRSPPECRLIESNMPSDGGYASGFNAEVSQGGYGSTSTEYNNRSPGYSSIPAWPHPRSYTPATESWHPYAQTQQPSLPPSSGFNQHSAEPWAEASASYSRQHANNQAIHTTQAHGFRDNSRDYRNIWS